LEEYPLDVFADLRTVEVLAERYAALGQALREGIDTSDEGGDQDTADLLTEVSREVDKDLWFLEAHLQEKS
jgi:starvation-inducible DNA-binding protein